jgi:ubiquinone/menaquinone biosynthesis C-methylase UbiE/uncharacterized protein YbaR (Trm112 family)
MLPPLWEETFPLICTALALPGRSDDRATCSAPLDQRDDITLVCSDSRCGAEYRINDEIPVLLPPDHSVPTADYDDELLAQMYAEMHFATFRTESQPWSGPSDQTDDPTALARALYTASDLTGPFYSAITETILAHLPSRDGVIADIACGMARMAFEFETHGWHGRYVGIDLSSRLLSEARRAFSGEIVSTRITADFERSPRSSVVSIQAPKVSSERSMLAVGDATRLALASQSCDAVLGLNLIDRVADPAATVKELWRCVAPGGILVLADPFQWQHQAPEKRIYSFDPVQRWLDGAIRVDLPPNQRNIIFAMRRRASREVMIYDDAVAIFKRTR